VEIVHAGEGQLICCGKSMKPMVPGTTDGAAEKHVPVIEKVDDGYLVKIGSIEHPSLQEHYIEWIEVLTEDGRIGRKYLKPGDKPEAKFYCKSPVVVAREYCNIHGLWSKENN
jgi:superoxide reductase